VLIQRNESFCYPYFGFCDRLVYKSQCRVIPRARGAIKIVSSEKMHLFCFSFRRPHRELKLSQSLAHHESEYGKLGRRYST
jgi:hypothetical protein